MTTYELRLRDRFGLMAQNLVAYLCAPITLTVLTVLIRVRFRWRVVDHRRIRREFRQDLRRSDGPVMVCANHLTMADSPLIAWALAPTWWYLLHFKSVPWNVPERKNFAHKFLPRAGAYLAKCISVIRGGDRTKISRVLKKLQHLLTHRHTVLMFPEGGRSRTGRVDSSNPALATGRLVKGLPNARVLCVYLRGNDQDRSSNIPIRGESFYCATSWLEPRSEYEGLRGSVEISSQIMRRIQEMEEDYFSRPSQPDQ